MGLSRARERLLRRLRTRKGRPKEGLVLVEGPRAVAAALDAGVRFRFALAAPGIRTEALRGAGVEVIRLPRRDVEAFADTEAPQGLLAVVDEPAGVLPQVAAREEATRPRLLVLDGVQDPGNAGALVRSAAAFGVDAVVVLDGSVDAWNPKAVRASAGEAFRISLVRRGWEDFRAWLDAARLPLLVADAAGADVRTLEAPGAESAASASGAPPGWALLIGSEGHGPRADARSAAAALVSLPLAHGVESLNAAVAGSVLLWALGPGTRRPNGERPSAGSPDSENPP